MSATTCGGTKNVAFSNPNCGKPVKWRGSAPVMIKFKRKTFVVFPSLLRGRSHPNQRVHAALQHFVVVSNLLHFNLKLTSSYSTIALEVAHNHAGSSPDPPARRVASLAPLARALASFA